jgi:hypothetical protein
VDKAEIFTELTLRNAVRREAKLPPLNVRIEFDHAVEVTAWREACVKHADDIARVVALTLHNRSAVNGWSDLRPLNVSSQCWRNVVFIHPHRDIR